MKPYFETDLGKLYHGDCMEVMKELAPVDLILTDPPYNISSGGGGIYKRCGKKHLENIANSFGTDFTPGKYLLKSQDLMIKYNAYWWCSRYIVNDYLNFCKERNYNFDILIWYKNNPLPAKNNSYLPDTEYCIFMRNNSPYFNNDLPFDYYRKIFLHNVMINNGHPTPKPIVLMEKLIKVSSTKNQLILDPFAGSGTTGVACHRLQRRYVLIEKEEKYCKIIKERLILEKQKGRLF